MFILDTHIHKLRFRIDTNAPIDYMNRWKKLKYDCESGDNAYVVEKMKTYCKLEQNKNDILNSGEKWIGVINNIIIHKSESLENCKLACQEHYTQTVLSLLEL